MTKQRADHIFLYTYHVLALPNRAVILDTANNLSLRWVATKHSQYQTSISNKDGLASLDRCCKLGVRAGKLLAATLEVVIGSEGNALALYELNLLGTIGEETSTDLGSPIILLQLR